MNIEDSNVVGRSNLAAALDRYGKQYPGELEMVERFAEFVRSEANCYERDCWRGHVTGAAWLVNGAGTHTLLTHHRKLDMWLQLGGHSDGDPDTTAVAMREAREESGLQVRLLDPNIFDVDIHPIPARKQEPEHWHFDVRFLMQATASEEFVVSAESVDLAWVALSELPRYTAESSILRMAEKWQARPEKSLQNHG
jgi:8-oxo-dGTP pyrophosphatase MutT (NUDIX family)